MGMRGVAGSWGATDARPAFPLPAAWLDRVVLGRFPSTADNLNNLLPELPGACLRDGGPAVVAQITCLANQGEALIVYALCGPVLEAVEG